MTYNSDVEGGGEPDERSPMLRQSSEIAKPDNDHSTFWTILHFFGGGIYAPDAATYDPIEILLNTEDEKEKDELTVRWRDNKLSELSFIGVVAALLAGVLTSTGSWPQVLPSGRESPWPIRTAWYCGIILSLFSILTAADQTVRLHRLSAHRDGLDGIRRLLAAQGDPASFALPRGIVLLLAGLAAVTFLVEGAILDWGALLLTGMGLVGLAQGGVGYMIFSVAMTAGRLAGDRAVRRLGETRILCWGGLLTAAGFAVVLTVPVAGIALAGFALVGLGASNIVPVLFSAAGRQTTMPAPLAIAAVTTTGYAGILAGPAGIGLVSQRIGLPGAFWMLAGLMILVTLASRRAARG